MITLFDIPADSVKARSWSPNTWKARLAITYKGLAHRTSWVEYPDIKTVLQTHNIGPSAINPDGTPFFSVPAIIDVDDTTGEIKAALADSLEIAKYLDTAYPDTPKLVTDAEAHEKFVIELRSIMKPFYFFVFRATLEKLNDRSKAHFSRSHVAAIRGDSDAQTIEEIVVSPEALEERWKGDVKSAFDALDHRLGEEREGKWVLGDTVSFSDLILAAFLIWSKATLGEESQEWKDVMSWNGGRWERFYQHFSRYEVVE